MSQSIYSRPSPIQIQADGTVKQVNPFSGTEVWTVPGRGNRPLSTPAEDVRPITAADHENACAFCSARTLDTPPEKARVVHPSGPVDSEFDRLGDHYAIKRRVLLEDQGKEVPEFRRVANLFEILSFDFWEKNFDFRMDEEVEQWRQRYLSSAKGREHVLKTIRAKRKAAGKTDEIEEEELIKQASAFFGGGHDLIIGRRHYVDGATHSNQLASSGTLTPDEHAALIGFTADSIRMLYKRNRYARYVAVFQNWLKPAGASFDHLHKQLVAIDDRGVQNESEIALVRKNPNVYNEWAVDYASRRNLIIAENDHAICFAGFGHRYPTLEVFSKSPTPEPWLQTAEEIRGMSDILHACHAATGPDVPCNEEWHHKPIDVDTPMPWRIMIKWRISNLAGFEGGTKIYINTLTPWDIRDKVVTAMYALRDAGKIAPSIRIATECQVERNSLKYNPLLQK